MPVRKRTWKSKQGTPQSVWMVDFVFKRPDGTTVRIRERSSVNTKEGAKEYERLRREVLLNPPPPPVKAAPTLNEFAETFMVYSRNNNKPSSVVAKEGILEVHLKPAFGDTPLNEISLEKIEAYKAAKIAGTGPIGGEAVAAYTARTGAAPAARPLSAKSVNNHLLVLKKMFSLAVEMGKLDKFPKVKQLKLPPSEFEFLTFEETPRFLAVVPREDYALALFALRSGLRLGEILELKWEDLDLVTGRVRVRRSIWRGEVTTPKSGRPREVPLSKETIAVLQSHRHLRGPYVFCYDNGDALTHDSPQVKKLAERACKKAGLAKRLVFHDLRHTFASHLVMRGVPIKVVQELLGHADIQTTLRYAHLSPDMKNDAVNVLDKPVPSGKEGQA